MIKSGFEVYLLVVNVIIIVYFNCGSFVSFFKCFNSVKELDLVIWISIFNVYVFYGRVEKSVYIFEMMLLRGLMFDNIVFFGIFLVCSYGGFIKEGFYYFRLMVIDYNMILSLEYYVCFVDFFGRVGFIDEVFRILILGSVGFELNILGVFVGVFKVYGYVKLVEWVVGKFFELEFCNFVNYILMSNMYVFMG